MAGKFTLGKFKKFSLITLASILVVGILISWYLYTGNYSTGSRSGRLVKISKKGFFFKTWEGQLDVGGITFGKKAGQASSIWEFSVDDDDKGIIRQLDALSGQRVKLYYEEKFYQFSWRGDTKYFINRVETIPE